MNDIVFKSISFIEGDDIANGRYFYNTTLPDAIDKMLMGLKYEFVDGKFQWVESQKPVNPIKDLKITIGLRNWA